ncbi:flagellar hook assembly protein FlgD [Bacillus fonticola]|uniref:flagellar hook assembly protein FlgD n=1 Tax=Bacillus fonticola TaxID=2728853 RepID=UPI001473E932|nr:flagellar hook assembly protein FlgD [Bacillus fonticola]
MSNNIDDSLYLSSTQKAERNTGSSVLGKDDFLKILMTQLENQDPMNPMDDKEFIAQMASFSTLEQMTNMSSNFEKFLASQQDTQWLSLQQLVGQSISFEKIVENEDGQTTPLTGDGLIQSVNWKSGEPSFTLQDGTSLNLEDVSKFNSVPQLENPLVTASYLIGKQVSWTDKEGNVQQALVQGVQLKQGAVELTLDSDETISMNRINSVESVSAG